MVLGVAASGRASRNWFYTNLCTICVVARTRCSSCWDGQLAGHLKIAWPALSRAIETGTLALLWACRMASHQNGFF
eukprot:3229757-Pleurochrysis_carterae.AAC.3